MAAIIELKGVKKMFPQGATEVWAVRGIDLEIREGELIVILGPSGSGKSTLLNLVGGMDRPTTGEIYYRGQALHLMDETELTLYRRRAVGFIFQFYNLIPNLTALENVELAARLGQQPLVPQEVLAQVGLEARAQHFPAQLSGGEQQRVAIARAVAKNPEILLCDEPTGALDYPTGKQVLELLQKINQQEGKTVLIITHNGAIADMAHRVIYMKDGRIEDFRVNASPKTAAEVSW